MKWDPIDQREEEKRITECLMGAQKRGENLNFLQNKGKEKEEEIDGYVLDSERKRQKQFPQNQKVLED